MEEEGAEQGMIQLWVPGAAARLLVGVRSVTERRGRDIGLIGGSPKVAFVPDAFVDFESTRMCVCAAQLQPTRWDTAGPQTGLLGAAVGSGCAASLTNISGAFSQSSGRSQRGTNRGTRFQG